MSDSIELKDVREYAERMDIKLCVDSGRIVVRVENKGPGFEGAYMCFLVDLDDLLAALNKIEVAQWLFSTRKRLEALQPGGSKWPKCPDPPSPPPAGGIITTLGAGEPSQKTETFVEGGVPATPVGAQQRKQLEYIRLAISEVRGLLACTQAMVPPQDIIMTNGLKHIDYLLKEYLE